MATRTSPLVSAAVLASTAAIAVATPAIMPSVQLPSPHALAAAKVQLTTFSDLLSITPEDWSNVLFVGYGEAISPNQDPDFDWAAAYNNLANNPFVNCDFNCQVNGPSGILYLALDAIFNGNGTGYAPVYDAEGDPISGYPTWSVGAINYLFEAGIGSGTAYLLAQPFGDPKSPLYNPPVAQIITQAFNGAENVTNFYVAGLTALAALAQQVPTVGPYIYGAINSYLGPNTSDEQWGDYLYSAGLSGVLKYIVDVIASGGNPYPPYGPTVETAASVAPLAAAAAPAAATVAEAPKVEAAPEAAAKLSAPAVSVPADAAPAAEVKVSAPAENKVESVPAVAEVAVSAPVESAPEVGEIKDSTPVVDVPEVKVPEVEVPEVKVPEVKVPDLDLSDLEDTAPAVTPKGQVSGGVESAADKAASNAGGSESSAGASGGTATAAAKDNDAPKADAGADAAGSGAETAGSDNAGSGSADSGKAESGSDE